MLFKSNLENYSIFAGLLLGVSQFSLYGQAINASEGIAFGLGSNDPTASKGTADQDLEFEFFSAGKMQIFRYGQTLPTFQAGEGFTKSVTAGKWYRIAQSSSAGKRANAEFSLRDDISGGGHSTAVFRAGISYGDAARAGVTLISHTGYNTTTFSQVRIVEGSTYVPSYLEVYVRRSGSVRFSISDNLGNGGWTPVNWQQAPSIPSGYTPRVFNIDKSFVIGDSKNRFSVARGGRVDIDGSLYLNNQAVLNQGTADARYLRTNNAGFNSLDRLNVANNFTVENSSNGFGTAVTLGPGSVARPGSNNIFAVGDDHGAGNTSDSVLIGDDNHLENASGSLALGSDADIYNARDSFSVGEDNDIGVKNDESKKVESSSVLGFNLINQTSHSTVVGRFNQDKGYDSNVLFAVGNGTTTKRSNALEVHKNGDARVNGSFFAGSNNTAVYGFAKAVKDNAAFGKSNKISGGESNLVSGYGNRLGRTFWTMVAGYENKVGGSNSLVVGSRNKVGEGGYQGSHFVTGSSNEVKNYRNQALGWNNKVLSYDSLAAGKDNMISRVAYHSKVLGLGLNATSAGMTVIGQYNEEQGSEKSSIVDVNEPIFVVGNGTSNNERSDALVVKRNGDVIINKAQGDISMGRFTQR